MVLWVHTVLVYSIFSLVPNFIIDERAFGVVYVLWTS